MPFSAGELCCMNEACVLLDTATGTTATWDKIPHVTEIAFTMTANIPTLVTSSTGGKETSACGTISQTGTLSIACHKGTGPGLLIPNRVYHLRWAQDCDTIWNPATCTVEATPTEYYEAYVRITSLPLAMNISANQAQVNQYAFQVVSWVMGPEDYDQEGESTVNLGFTC